MKALRGSSDLLAATTLACAGVAVTFPPLQSVEPVRVVFALLLVLLVPGYALLAALAPDIERWSANALAFSLGLSISATLLTGLALNFTSWGLQRRPIAIALAVVVVAASIAGSIRRPGVSTETVHRAHVLPSGGQFVLLFLALLVAAAAVGVSRLGARQANQRTTFTQLWMLPSTDSSGVRLDLGIRNNEGASTTYRLLVRAGALRVQLRSSVRLANGEQWTETLQLPESLPQRTPVIADLYRVAHPHLVYRHVTFRTP